MVKPLSLLVLVLLVLQTLILGIVAVQAADSKLFRLAVGFLGLGLMITPMVLRTAGRLADDKATHRKQVIELWVLILLLVGPWVPQLFGPGLKGMRRFGEFAVTASALQLAAAALGMAATAFQFAFKPPAGEEGGKGMLVTRIMAGLLLVYFALYSIFPMLVRVHPFFLSLSPFDLRSGYAAAIALDSGEPGVWLVDCAFTSWGYYRFYAAFFIKKELA